jgi:hypothetical protein
VVTRAQAIDGGLTRASIEANLTSRRWQPIHRGVYATFSGPVPRRSYLWASVLRAGPGAMLSHETAAEIWGLSAGPSRGVHVTVPENRYAESICDVVIHRSTRAALSRHPTRLPPLTRVEDTVIDLTQTAAHVDDAIAWLARAIGGRHTTAPRLAARLRERGKLRWRSILRAALNDVDAGCHSLIEVKYLRDVERAHGLPRSQRQVRRESGESTATIEGGPRRTASYDRVGYDDVRYRRYATRVELDGRAAHPEHARWRDMRRDNAATVEGDRVLRYGLGDVESYPCQLAAQIAAVLCLGGWRGRPSRCTRPGCVVA